MLWFRPCATKHSRRSFIFLSKGRSFALHLYRGAVHEERKQLTDAMAELCDDSCRIRRVGRRWWAVCRLQHTEHASQGPLRTSEDGLAPPHCTCLFSHAYASKIALFESFNEDRADANLQQVAPLRGNKDFIGIEPKLRPGALIVQEQAVDERWNEGARGRLACMPHLNVSTLCQAI